MRIRFNALSFSAPLLVGWLLTGVPSAWAVDAAAVKAVFVDPPREYSTAPL